MKVFSRYVSRRILVQTMILTIGSAVILVTVQILSIMNLLIARGNIAVTAFQIGVLLAPSFMIGLSAPAVAVAAYRVLMDLHDRSEIIAIQAAGATPGDCARPIIVSAGIVGAFAIAGSLFVEPASNLMAQGVIASARQDILVQAIQTGGFRSFGPHLIIKVGGAPGARALSDIVIVDSRQENKQTVYLAPTGYFIEDGGDKFIVLRDGWILSREDADKYPYRIEFKSYVFALDEANSSSPGVGLPTRSSTADLLDQCRDSCFWGGKNPVARELHRRFSDWLYVFAFAALAILASGRAGPSRGARKIHLLLAIPVGIIIRAAGALALGQAGESPLVTACVYLIPVGAALVSLALATGDRSCFAPRFVGSSTRVEGKPA